MYLDPGLFESFTSGGLLQGLVCFPPPVHACTHVSIRTNVSLCMHTGVLLLLVCTPLPRRRLAPSHYWCVHVCICATLQIYSISSDVYHANWIRREGRVEHVWEKTHWITEERYTRWSGREAMHRQNSEKVSHPFGKMYLLLSVDDVIIRTFSFLTTMQPATYSVCHCLSSSTKFQQKRGLRKVCVHDRKRSVKL